MNKREIEKAKSYFVLAQILIILSGFLFASSGVAYASTFNSLDRAVSLKLSEPENSSENLSQQLIQVYGDLSIATFSLYKIFLASAFVISIGSIVFWFIGNRKMDEKVRHFENRNKK